MSTLITTDINQPEIKLHIVRDTFDIFIKYNFFYSEYQPMHVPFIITLHKIKIYIDMYHALFPKSVLCSFLWTAKLMSYFADLSSLKFCSLTFLLSYLRSKK